MSIRNIFLIYLLNIYVVLSLLRVSRIDINFPLRIYVKGRSNPKVQINLNIICKRLLSFSTAVVEVSLLIPYPSVQHFIWPLHWCLLADICNHTYIPECGTENEEDKYNRRLFIDECDLFEYNCDYETDFYPINYSSCFNIPPTPCPPVIPCPSIPPCPDHRLHDTSTTTTAATGFKLSSKFNVLPSKPELWMNTEKEPEPEPETTTDIIMPVYSRLGKKKEKSQQMRKRFTVKKTITKKNFASTFKNFASKFPVKKTTLGSSLPMYMLKGKRRYSPRPRKKKKKTQPTTKRFTVKKTITKKTSTTTKNKKNTVKKNGRNFNKAIKAIVKKNPAKKKKDDSEFLE